MGTSGRGTADQGTADQGTGDRGRRSGRRGWAAAALVVVAVAGAGATGWPASGSPAAATPASAEPVATTEPVASAEPLEVAIVGDSLIFQSADAQHDAIEAGGWTGTVSGNPGQAIDAPAIVAALDDAAASPGDVVVIATATNDNVAVASRAAEVGIDVALDEYRARLAGTLDRFADRCVVVVNARADLSPFYSPWMVPFVDAALAEVTAAAGGVVVDWDAASEAHAEWFGPDQLHFEGSADPAVGAAAYAEAIAAGVTTCAGAPTR